MHAALLPHRTPPLGILYMMLSRLLPPCCYSCCLVVRILCPVSTARGPQSKAAGKLVQLGQSSSSIQLRQGQEQPIQNTQPSAVH